MWEQMWQWFSVSANQRMVVIGAAALCLGIIIGRLLHREKDKEIKSLTKEGDRAFFKGIQFILANDHDHAIEEFTKSVQINSDTIETYMALGNLYRSKGNIDRAIRIRQSIILRPNIEQHIRVQAILDMGMDYRKGGFLKRALETFLEVVNQSPANLAALREMEKIYEEMNDWSRAFDTRQRISKLTGGDDRHILAHHQTELGKRYQEGGDLSKARSCYKRAVSIDETCVDPYLHLGDLYFEQGEHKKAIATWKKVVSVAPRFTFLAYGRLEGAYATIKNLKPIEEFLKESAELKSDAFTHLALARYLYNEKRIEDALKELESALELHPSFWEARKLMGEILLGQGMEERALEAYGDLIPYLNEPFLKFQCIHCGFRPNDLCWQCPQCKKWDTIDFADAKIENFTSPAGQFQQTAPMVQSDQKEDS
jgi:lipopolysaccharide biosynthesis regulator YciM